MIDSVVVWSCGTRLCGFTPHSARETIPSGRRLSGSVCVFITHPTASRRRTYWSGSCLIWFIWHPLVGLVVVCSIWRMRTPQPCAGGARKIFQNSGLTLYCDHLCRSAPLSNQTFVGVLDIFDTVVIPFIIRIRKPAVLETSLTAGIRTN